MDPGEKAVPQFTLTVRERDNSLMDQAHEHRVDRRQRHLRHPRDLPAGQVARPRGVQHPLPTTGITYKGENDPKATTQLGAAWSTSTSCRSSASAARSTGASQPYTAGTNGGIVGTVSYDTTRNELDPADAVTETYQPGIPDVPVHLYASEAVHGDRPGRRGQRVPPGQGDRAAAGPGPERPTRRPTRSIDNPRVGDRGAFVKGPRGAGQRYTSETWARRRAAARPGSTTARR